ncbi:MAG: protease inhibitor I42 family protein [Candidatus Bathyarchaeia archaeon]|jgi:predicted secreted protein
MKAPTCNIDTASRQFHKLTVRLGIKFEIDLPCNRTTGHTWEANYDKLLLQLSTINYKLVSAKTGAGGTETFTFIPCKTGITLIRMLYKRPWEKINAKEVAYEVTIED